MGCRNASPRTHGDEGAVSAFVPGTEPIPGDRMFKEQWALQNNGQAFYCPTADIIAWDADGLLPAQVEEFGTAGAVVVLAHEIGHAVHTRLGIGADRGSARYPPILLEAMADCFAGVALAHLIDFPGPGLPLDLVERDQALLALVGFRDPVGVDSRDEGAHGNAFDRVSAFQSGARLLTLPLPPPIGPWCHAEIRLARPREHP